jgi:superfamily II DNA or RNA helicase
VRDALRHGWALVDVARTYDERGFSFERGFSSHPHQTEALDAWKQGGMRGTVVLPTGSGKTHVAHLAIEAANRDTLVVVPTLDLLDQWARGLAEVFDCEVGMLGGGEHDPRVLTVSTYDSAAMHMHRLGGRYGLVIFDEVHHLPGDLYRQAAAESIAPFRLGLTATYERADGKHGDIANLLGPVVYRRGIKELAGDILADYTVETVEVPMSAEDQAHYEAERGVYRGFIDDENVWMRGRHAWRNFLAATNRSEKGRRALEAYHNQKRTALAHSNKIDELGRILEKHRGDRVIVFTNDNATVYRISERFLLPTITHQTPVKERGEVLERFNDGTYRVVVTSKVLNEGVDVPEANVAVILSGTGSVREHVQRLGRILRRRGDKRATLYELVTADSVETHVNRRRREHDAYR